MLIKLSKEYREAAIKIFVDIFKDSEFYVELFPENREMRMTQLIESNIDYIIEDELSFVFLDNAKVVGFIFNIDYKKLSKDSKKLAMMFSGTDSYNPYFNEIDVPISKFDNVIYILNLGITDQYRNRGISKILLDETLSMNQDKHIVCDLVNMNLVKSLKDRNFKFTEIEEDYYLCVRDPIK